MAKSKKKDTFSKVSAVKSNARDRVGTPKASFVITPKNQRPPRFKPNWTDEESNIESFFGGFNRIAPTLSSSHVDSDPFDYADYDFDESNSDEVWGQ
jgi:hypothetical protein